MLDLYLFELKATLSNDIGWPSRNLVDWRITCFVELAKMLF